MIEHIIGERHRRPGIGPTRDVAPGVIARRVGGSRWAGTRGSYPAHLCLPRGTRRNLISWNETYVSILPLEVIFSFYIALLLHFALILLLLIKFGLEI